MKLFVSVVCGCGYSTNPLHVFHGQWFEHLLDFVKLKFFNVESSTILSWLPQLCKSLHAELHYDSMNIIDKTQETVRK